MLAIAGLRIECCQAVLQMKSTVSASDSMRCRHCAAGARARQTTPDAASRRLSSEDVIRLKALVRPYMLTSLLVSFTPLRQGLDRVTQPALPYPTLTYHIARRACISWRSTHLCNEPRRIVKRVCADRRACLRGEAAPQMVSTDAACCGQCMQTVVCTHHAPLLRPCDTPLTRHVTAPLHAA